LVSDNENVTGVVLMYHRVSALQEDAYGLAVQPRHFAEHVEHLTRLGCVVPLAEMLHPNRALKIAITFDDGYADNAAAAALLAQAGLPATYFITTGRLGGQPFWWDRLAAAFLGAHPLPDGVDVTLGSRDLWLALNDAPARKVALTFLHRRLRPLPPAELDATVVELLGRLDVPKSAGDALSLTLDGLRRMAALPDVEIGAHTRTHLQLAGQTEALQREEVLGSVSDLRSLLGQPVTSFAYPFGTRRAVGELAPRLVREAGCLLACSTERGVVTERAAPHRLPRLNVRDWNAAELDLQISRLDPRG